MVAIQLQNNFSHFLFLIMKLKQVEAIEKYSLSKKKQMADFPLALL
jgi:hypothetical protein